MTRKERYICAGVLLVNLTLGLVLTRGAKLGQLFRPEPVEQDALVDARRPSSQDLPQP